jgi:N-acetylneuraminate synthase
MGSQSYFYINNRKIGNNALCFLIAEVAQSHDGSLGLAHSFIDAAADAGADAIKFQTHIAYAESTSDEKFRVNFSYEDKTRYEYWRRMEFTEEQWRGLYEHAIKRNIIFLSSPFSVEAVKMLDGIGIAAWKIGSGEVSNPLLFSSIIKTKKPILLSTGMSNWREIEEAVETIRQHGSPFAIFQCTSKYPTKIEEIGLNVLNELSERFNVPVGLSDHSGSIFPALAAMATEASLIEVHVTFHRSMFGPDVPISLTFEELSLLANARNAFYVMKTHPVDKNVMAAGLSEMRSLFNKSVALKEDKPAGTVLMESMLTTKKPGTGIPAKNIDECIGKRLKRDVTANRVLTWDDLE